jgi:peptidoglycan/LPS O-acetylase OafA/YrhL
MLGDASYAIYTVHVPLLTFLVWSMGLRAWFHPDLKSEFAFVAILIPIGVLLHLTDEAVRRRFKARFLSKAK